jgi:hypothetical protein
MSFDRMNASDGGEIGYLSHAEQAAYGDNSGAEFGAAAASGDYIGDESHEDVSGVELEYEQPLGQDQVQLFCTIIFISNLTVQFFIYFTDASSQKDFSLLTYDASIFFLL